MRKQKKLILILASCFALLLTLYFAVVLPIVNKEEPPKPPLSVDEGEGLLYDMRLLYENITREHIKEINIHNQKGDYSFVRSNPDKKDSDFVIRQGEATHFLPEYDHEKIAQLVVSLGTTYVREKIINGDVSEEVFADFGLALEQEPAYFELKTFKGETYKVYIGEKIITDGGYYLRREGVDSVYVSQSTSIGDSVLANPEYYVKPFLTTTYANYGFFYTKDFTIWSKKAEDGDVIHRDDGVQFEYCEVTADGYGEKMTVSLDLREAQIAIKDAFEGRKIGDGGFTFVRKYPDNYEDKKLAGRHVEYYVSRILGFDRLEICLNYLHTDERTPLQAGDIYAITDPRDKRGYTPNTSMYMGILESLEAMEGTETVAIGLSSENIVKYGLGKYKIYYESPKKVASDPQRENDVIISSYEPNILYVSERQPDGSFFVGSVLFDIVARVEGEKMAFLLAPFSDWVTNLAFQVNIKDVEEMTFDFDYADADQTHTFLLSHRTEGTATRTSVLHKQTEKAITTNNFSLFYMNLLTTFYVGDYDGERDVQEIIKDKKNAILTLDLRLTSKETRRYEFFPYSARKVLVAIDGGAYFYITSAEIEKLYRDIGLLLSGEAPDYENNN